MDLRRYTKYFNYGYFLSKNEPNFLSKLLKTASEAPELSEPLIAGKSQYNREKVLNKLKGLGKGQSIVKGKDRAIEPDI